VPVTVGQSGRRPLDTTGELSALGSPVLTGSMLLAGAAGPITVVGRLALLSAEVLGLVTAVAAPRPGAAGQGSRSSVSGGIDKRAPWYLECSAWLYAPTQAGGL
jgi:hypothetical protein